MPKKAVPGSPGVQKATRQDGSLRGYVATYRDPTTRDKNGEPSSRSKTFRTLAEAKAFRVETLRAIEKGRYITPTGVARSGPRSALSGLTRSA